MEAGGTSFPGSWSPDGNVLVFSRLGGGNDWDIGVWSADGSETALLDTSFSETAPALSPDGRLIAYVSDESGSPEVYLAAFPDLEGRLQVSISGGSQPVWAPDGRDLYYRAGEGLLGVEVLSATPVKVGANRIVIDRSPVEEGPVPGYPSYDVARDGEHFLFLDSEPMPRVDSLEVVLNWFTDLERLVPIP